MKYSIKKLIPYGLILAGTFGIARTSMNLGYTRGRLSGLKEGAEQSITQRNEEINNLENKSNTNVQLFTGAGLLFAAGLASKIIGEDSSPQKK